MDTGKVRDFVTAAWDFGPRQSPVAQTLEQIVALPALSPAFDPEWSAHGRLDDMVRLVADAVERLKREWPDAADVAVRIHGGPDNPETDEAGQRRTPLLEIDIPARGADGCVLLYGHLDKQPGLEGQWSPGLDPWTPVVRDGRLYGRGGADDGYAPLAAFSAVMALRAQGAAHARCVILAETREESGSEDLPHFIRRLAPALGDVSLVVCLDSGCGDYDRLWTTTSLRGVVSGTLSVEVLREGVHSGDASGIVPSPFRILRRLLSRVEDEATGVILPDFLRVDIPAETAARARATAALLGAGVHDHFPFLDGVRPVCDAPDELSLNRSWRSQLVVKGLDGIPPTAGSGNVLLPSVAASLSLRLPPTLDSRAAGEALKALLEANPPCGAKVTFSLDGCGDGWAAPEDAGWLDKAAAEASATYFGADMATTGEGGSIPFMGLLAEMFPSALFLVTGILGPGSNAHGPDEFLDIAAAQKLTMCVAHVIAAQAMA